MLNKKIPPIFVINLLRDIDKKNHMAEVLERLNINYHFFEAVDGKQLSNLEIAKIYDQKIARKQRKRDLTVGELGCSLSHLGIYKKMLKEDIKQAIIFEDDAVIEEGFMEVISQINHFPNDWELVLLGHIETKYDCKIKRTTINNLSNYYFYQSIAKLYGAHGYIINQIGAQKILDANQKIYNPIDHFTGDYKFVNFYAIYPKVVNVNNDLLSSIGNERFAKKNLIFNKLKQKSSFLRQLGIINQKRKNIKLFRKLECLLRLVIMRVRKSK